MRRCRCQYLCRSRMRLNWRLGGCRATPNAAGPGDAESALPVLADFHDGDVDDDFGARLVEIVDEFLRQQKFVGRAAHDDGVLAGDAVDFGAGEYVAQGGLHVVEVVLLPGVGEIEGLDGLLVEFGALDARVLGDKDSVGGDWPPEGAGHGANDAQGVQERDVVEVDLDALGVVVGIEEDVDAGGLADGLVDDLGVFGHVQGEGLVGDGLEVRPER